MTNDHQGYQLGGAFILLLFLLLCLATVVTGIYSARAEDLVRLVTTTCTPGPSPSDCPSGYVTFCTVVVIENSREQRRMWSPRYPTPSTPYCVLEDLPADKRRGKVEFR